MAVDHVEHIRALLGLCFRLLAAELHQPQSVVHLLFHRLREGEEVLLGRSQLIKQFLTLNWRLPNANILILV